MKKSIIEIPKFISPGISKKMNMETTRELYGIIVKEYLKTSMDYNNIAKSNESLFILESGFKIVTNIFKLQCTNAAESIYKICKQAILLYLEYIDQIISLNKFAVDEATNANIFIFNKLIKRDEFVQSNKSIRENMSNVSRLCGILFDWTNAKYSLEDRNAIADTFLSGYIELFAHLDNADIILSFLEILREKYGSMDLMRFQIYLKELYYVLRKCDFVKDRFELYAAVYSESTENQYKKLLLTEDKKEFRKFFSIFKL